MRVIVLANWGLGQKIVEALDSNKHVEIISVLGHSSAESDDPWINAVRDYCLKSGLLFIPAKKGAQEQLATLLRKENPDLLAVHAWPDKLSPEVFSLPRMGTVNFHPSLLPRHRGRSPHLAALRSGDKITGLTCHVMDEGFDTGPIVAQMQCSMDANALPQDVIENIKELAPGLVNKAIENLQNPDFQPTPQEITNFRSST